MSWTLVENNEKWSFDKSLLKSIGTQLYGSGISQLLEDSMTVVVSEESEAIKDEFIIWPCNLLWTKILLLRILMNLRSMPFWINDHLSLRRRDSISLSSQVMSGLILISLGRDLALDKSNDTSMVRFSLTSIGRGYCPDNEVVTQLSRLVVLVLACCCFRQ